MANKTPKTPPQNILWFNWKDWQHPLAGGAEVVLQELCHRLIRDGHHVTLLTAAYEGAKTYDQLDGVDIIRVGRNRYLHSFQALRYYKQHLRGQFDYLIEVVNTAPYFSVLASHEAHNVLFYHQLAREIWYYETSFPINALGYYVLEPLATRRLARARQTRVVTVSNSTKRDLQRFGFKPAQIDIISEGIHMTPLSRLERAPAKFRHPTLLSLGAIRPMKRTLDQIKAFELAKTDLPDLKLHIAGDVSTAYGQQVLDYIAASPHRADIHYFGRVNHSRKRQLMQQCHALLVTSLKEGWGLVVSEANSQGTPALAYDADGLRDSVRHGETGLLSPPRPADLAACIIQLFANQPAYERMRQAGHAWSQQLTFDQAYLDFWAALAQAPTAKHQGKVDTIKQ